jgi:hypothetical protein
MDHREHQTLTTHQGVSSSVSNNELWHWGTLLEDVEQLLQLGVTREKWLVSDQLSCNLYQVRICVCVNSEAA